MALKLLPVGCPAYFAPVIYETPAHPVCQASELHKQLDLLQKSETALKSKCEAYQSSQQQLEATTADLQKALMNKAMEMSGKIMDLKQVSDVSSMRDDHGMNGLLSSLSCCCCTWLHNDVDFAFSVIAQGCRA